MCLSTLITIPKLDVANRNFNLPKLITVLYIKKNHFNSVTYLKFQNSRFCTVRTTLTTMGRHSSSNHSPSSRRHRSHRSISPPPREKQRPSRHEPVRSDSGSPDLPPPPPRRSRSPSPRTKRLKKVQSEREPKREHERNHRGRDSEKDVVERKERKRVENDDDDGGRNGRSSRSRHERSPEHHRNGRSRHRSQSPQHHSTAAANSKPRDEVSGDIQPQFKPLFQLFSLFNFT